MKSVSWLAFLNPNRKAGTLIHFFPATPGSATPYPVDLSVSLFGRGVPKRTISLEGARLFNPDGVRIEDIFSLAEADDESTLALQIELQTNNAKSDISASQCLIELPSAEGGLIFAPHKSVLTVNAQNSNELLENVGSEKVIMAMKDSQLCPSVLVVNCKQNELRPEIYYRDLRESPKALMPLGQVAPMTALERKLDGTVFGEPQPREMSWGNLRTRVLSAESGHRDMAMYLIYREVKTSKIVSVHAL